MRRAARERDRNFGTRVCARPLRRGRLAALVGALALAAHLALSMMTPCAAEPASQGVDVSPEPVARASDLAEQGKAAPRRPEPVAPPAGFDIPRFFDPGRRLARPDLAGRSLRILVDDDYPPFGFTTPDGALVGFNVDLARALCETLALTCTVQPRRFDTLVEALAQGEGDAVVASLGLSPALMKRVDFTLPYYRTPARFMTRAGGDLADATPATLAGKAIGVEARTAHEDYLRAFFPAAQIKTFVTPSAARAALRTGDVEALFGDGVTFAIWLAGSEAEGCCRLVGGPFTESRWFGDGVAIAVRKGDAGLRRGLDWALHRLAQNGGYSELYLKYFPVGFY